MSAYCCIKLDLFINIESWCTEPWVKKNLQTVTQKVSPDVWADFETTQNLWLYRPLEGFRRDPNLPSVWATFLPNSFTCADQVSCISTVTSRWRALSFYCVGAQSNWTVLSFRNVMAILAWSLIGSINYQLP